MSGPTLTLRQIQSPLPGQEPLRLVLSGACGPVNAIKWGVSQRHSTRWYPGSGDAACFLDGPEEAPVELQFEWLTRTMGPRDALLGRASDSDDACTPIEDADRLAEVFESLVRDRALVELSWRMRTRVGVLEEITPSEGFESEYPTVTVTFQPTASPDWEAARPRAPIDATSLFEEMQADWARAIDALLAPITLVRDTVESIESGIDALNATFRRFSAVTSAVRDTGASAVQVYRGVGEVLTTVIGQTDALLSASAAPIGAIAQTDDPIAQARAHAYSGRLAAASRRARAKAALERPTYRGLEEGDLLGRHVAAEGDTIWSIAWRWYGDTGGAALIARRNGLTSTTLVAGTTLLIPRRPARA